MITSDYHQIPEETETFSSTTSENGSVPKTEVEVLPFKVIDKDYDADADCGVGDNDADDDYDDKEDKTGNENDGSGVCQTLTTEP